MEQLSWEDFKEQIEYFLDLLKQDTLTEETKETINKSLQKLVMMWTNPILYMPLREDGKDGK